MLKLMNNRRENYVSEAVGFQNLETCFITFKIQSNTHQVIKINPRILKFENAQNNLN